MSQQLSATQTPTNVRYGVLGFACSLSMITYLDRVCFGTVASEIQREFGLSESQKGILFSAFALAYAAFEVPSGWLGDVYGPKKTLIRIVLGWSLFTALTGLIYPDVMGAQLAFFAMVAIRFLFGVGEAGAYPNIARAFHNWFPFGQRGFAKGAVWMAGRFAGGITAFIVLAMMFQTNVDCRVVTHWRHIFWIFGGTGILWCFAFWLWFKDRPEQDSRVNQAELDLIQSDDIHAPAKVHVRQPSSTAIASDPRVTPPGTAPAVKVPWRELFSNPNLWMLCLMYFCAAYGWYFNITYLPGYLEQTFGLTRGEVWSESYWRFSFMAGAPLLFGSVACLAGGWLSDLYIKKTGNRKWGRRFFGVVGHTLCALSYFGAIFAENAWLFVLSIAMAAFWNDMTMGAAWASCLDIGRRYSGIVAGCMNTVGNLGGFAAGFLSGYIIDSARAPAIGPAVSQVALSVGSLGTSSGLGSAAWEAVPLLAIKGALDQATRPGWVINFIIFGSVYAFATLFWLGFDSTKPVAKDA